MKYTRRSPEVIEAFQWWRNGDHPDDGPRNVEGAIIRYYRHPAVEGNDVHKRCGHRWHDHGYMESWYVKGRNAYDVGEAVCPSDYIIIDDKPGARFKKHSIVSATVFEKVYAALEPAPPLDANYKEYEEHVHRNV